MCGLVGIAGNIVLSDLKIFNQMLIADQFRGRHSTGVVNVTGGESTFYKRALTSSDFLQLNAAQDLINVKATALIGHNRHATAGSIDDNNAHPFKHGDITLVHNGTLTSKHGLPDGNKFAVDSEAICYAMSQWEPDQVLEELSGAYALVWHDARDNTLHFARNDERDLCLAYASGCVYWASERMMLEWILDRNNVHNPVFYDLVAGKHVVMPLTAHPKSFDDLKAHDFSPKAVSYKGYYGGGTYYAGGSSKKQQGQSGGVVAKRGADSNVTRMKTLGDTAYAVRDEIDFFITDYYPFSTASNIGNAIGFDMDTNESVLLCSVPKNAIIMDMKGKPSMEVFYTSKVLRMTRMADQRYEGYHIEISHHPDDLQFEELSHPSQDVLDHEAIRKALGDEVTSEKKTQASSTFDKYTDIEVDGVEFKAHEIQQVLNKGCAWCSNPLSLPALLRCKVTDTGEPIHSHVCWAEFEQEVIGEKDHA